MSITEAFSMQPAAFSISTQASYDGYENLEVRKTFIKEIKFETIRIGGSPIEVYVGYNFEGQKIFQYLANSVNVHYAP